VVDQKYLAKMFYQKAVSRLRSLNKKKIVEKDIIDVLEHTDFDDFEFEITDELIDDIISMYNLPIDYEEEALREATRKFNHSVKGIVEGGDDADEDDWIPSVPVNDAAEKNWEEIQDKLDKIDTKYKEMTSV